MLKQHGRTKARAFAAFLPLPIPVVLSTLVALLILVPQLAQSQLAWAADLGTAAPKDKSINPEGMFRFLEKPGSYSIGLRVVEQYDRSRAFKPSIDDKGKSLQGETARPLQTLVWYPAKDTSAAKMTVGQYIELGDTEVSFGNPKSRVDGGKGWFEGWKAVLQDPLWAVRDAAPSTGKFPIVIYAPSFSSSPWENADLCEYLASYGYVVIASPGMGVSRESTHDVAGVNAQAQDISFLISYAHSLTNTDNAEVAVVGFSWGGLSNLFAAARDNRIKALVGLDGSLRHFSGLVKQAGDVFPEKQTIPMLFFKDQISFEDQARIDERFNSSGPNVLNAWIHGDLISVQMLGFFHPEFSSMSQRNERLWELDFPRWKKDSDYGRADGAIGYSWVARYTREFLDAYLKRNDQAVIFLHNEPAGNGVPLHVMAVDFRKAEPLSRHLSNPTVRPLNPATS